MKRLLAWHSTVAVVAFNTLAAALLLCLGLDAALAWRHHGRNAVTPSMEVDLQSFREVGAGRARAITAELDVYASSQPFAYNPWATFMQAPYHGDTIVVEDDPVLTHRRVPPPAAAGVPLVVWAFGGSTMFGWGVDDAHTVAALLQEELGRRLPGRRVEVVNFGQPYWYSSSEVAGLLALLRARPAPDAVVFLDGLNDASWISTGLSVPVFAGRARDAWERTRADARHDLPWFTLTSSFPPLRLVEWLRYRGTLAPVAGDDGYHHGSADPAAAIVSTYHANRRMAHDLTASRGIKSFFFIQPVPWLGEWRDGHARTDFQFGRREDAVRALRTLAAEAGEFSLIEALREIERPFVDGTHYSDAGNRRLAIRMAESMAPRLGR